MNDWTSEWFEYAHNPSIITNRSLGLLAVNKAARIFFEASNDVFANEGAFAFRRAADQEQLKRFARSVSADASDATVVGSVMVIARRLPASDALGILLRDLRIPVEFSCAGLDVSYGITQAEEQVILMMMKGLAPDEIALRLHNSVLTIRTHMKRIYKKLEVQTKEQMFVKVAQHLFISGKDW